LDDNVHQGIDVDVGEDLNLKEPIPDPRWVTDINEGSDVVVESEVVVECLEEELEVEREVEEFSICGRSRRVRNYFSAHRIGRQVDIPV
jgi:hypothetical protein